MPPCPARCREKKKMNSFLIRNGSTKSIAETIKAHFHEEGSRIHGVELEVVKQQIRDWKGPRIRSKQEAGERGLYDVGSWVEFRGSDMLWRLGMVVASHDPVAEGSDSRSIASNLSILESDEQEEGEVEEGGSEEDANQEGSKPHRTPKAREDDYRRLCQSQTDIIVDGVYHLVRDIRDIRWPLEALFSMFGETPFVFMQVLLLRAEKLMRFQRAHRHDFIGYDWNSWALQEFDDWVQNNDRYAAGDENAPSHHRYYHESFADHYKSAPEGAQQALRHVITEPFSLIDDVCDWEFSEGSLSCFQYASLFGHGFTIPIACVLIQFFLPLGMLTVVTNTSLISQDEGMPDDEEIDDDVFYETGRDLDCSSRWGTCNYVFIFSVITGAQVHKESQAILLMTFGVMCYYIMRVVPDQISKFAAREGRDDSVRSKLASLRQEVYNAEADTL